MASFTSPSGISMTRLNMVQAYFHIHPDHVPFVIGSRGATVRGVATAVGADIRINKSSDAFRIRGTIQAVEAAYFKLQEIANIANQRMPLVGLPQQRPMLNQRRHQNQQHQQHQQHQQQFVKGQSRPAPVNIHQDMPYDENDDYEYTPESPTYLPPEDPQDDHGGDTTTHKGN